MQGTPATTASLCPVCGCGERVAGWRTTVTTSSIGAHAFRPASDRFGCTVGPILRCPACGHMAVDLVHVGDAIRAAYEGAADKDAEGEEAGRGATAARDLATLERFVAPGRLLDVGCWTGALLAVAQARGWECVGVEPSAWAAAAAARRGLTVHEGTLDDFDRVQLGAFDAIVCCDVIEHLIDPVAAVHRLRDLLTPGGALLLTLPDAGSAVARVLKGQWWSVLPMHLHYFTRSSLTAVLLRSDLRPVYISRHPKVFTARYYVKRVAALFPLGHAATIPAEAKLGRRLVAPDLHDRLLVIASRP